MEKPPAFEVRCQDCKTSFALGTKNCVHCGRRLSGGLAAALGAASRPATAGDVEDPRGLGRPKSLYEVDDDEEAQTLGGGRSPVWILTALFLVISAVVRACGEQ